MNYSANANQQPEVVNSNQNNSLPPLPTSTAVSIQPVPQPITPVLQNTKSKLPTILIIILCIISGIFLVYIAVNLYTLATTAKATEDKGNTQQEEIPEEISDISNNFTADLDITKIKWSKINNMPFTEIDSISTDGRIGLGGDGFGDEASLANGTVILDEGIFKMWYSGIDKNGVRSIFYATSDDGLTWTKYNNESPEPSNSVGTDGRIPVGLPGSADSSEVGNPEVLKIDDEYKMWYVGQSKDIDDGGWTVFTATSNDGLTWTKVDNTYHEKSNTNSMNGRIPHGMEGTGDSLQILGIEVVYKDNKYLMMYNGYDGSKTRVFSATSSDGLEWEKINNSISANSNFIANDGQIPLGSTGTGDSGSTTVQVLYYAKEKYYSLYSGNAIENNDERNIFCAVSDDGLTWTKVSNEIPTATNSSTEDCRLSRGAAGSGDESGLNILDTVYSEDKFYTYYIGVGKAGRYIYGAIGEE